VRTSPRKVASQLRREREQLLFHTYMIISDYILTSFVRNTQPFLCAFFSASGYAAPVRTSPRKVASQLRREREQLLLQQQELELQQQHALHSPRSTSTGMQVGAGAGGDDDEDRTAQRKMPLLLPKIDDDSDDHPADHHPDDDITLVTTIASNTSHGPCPQESTMGTPPLKRERDPSPAIKAEGGSGPSSIGRARGRHPLPTAEAPSWSHTAPLRSAGGSGSNSKPPVSLGQLTVIDPGRIDSLRPAYHCESEIWPVGFRAARMEYHPGLRQVGH
jgi:hypothetical protein